ncbi:MAG: LamG-like jellyroll fold domain-containing protein [Planctomycetota bacterium]
MRSHPRTGLTLLELLLVMTILGIVFGLSLGAITGMDLAKGADAEVLRGALRAARTAALAERHPAAMFVETDEETGHVSLVVQRMRTVGTWHFERPDGRGTDELTAEPLQGARQVEDGFIGSALSFYGAGRGARAEIALQTQSRYDVRDGVSIEAMIRVEDVRSGGTVFQFSGRTRICGLEVTQGGGLTGWVAPVFVDGTGRERAGGRVDIKLPAGTLEEGEWTRVALVYDRLQLRIVVDGFVAGVTAGEGELGTIDGPLVIGGDPLPFQGVLDELVVRIVERSEPVPLSQNAVWPEGLPVVVPFDADGSIDTLLAQGPYEFVLPTDPDETVRVGRTGVVE